jgi:hypothetical protein
VCARALVYAVHLCARVCGRAYVRSRARVCGCVRVSYAHMALTVQCMQTLVSLLADDGLKDVMASDFNVKGASWQLFRVALDKYRKKLATS